MGKSAFSLQDYLKDLHYFFGVLRTQYELTKKYEDKFNYHFGIKFNLIELFNPDEERISRVIAQLLDPNGSHGQREIFLKCFLSAINNEIDKVLKKQGCPTQRQENRLLNGFDWKKVKVITELNIKDGRIDIFIELPEIGAIAIENKPWAGEQENQLQRYVDYLKNKCKGKKSLLIFLAPEGRKPESLDDKQRKNLEKEGKFLVVSYNKFLKNWLKECIKHCEAEKVRFFLKDFILWIEVYFPENDSFQEQ